MKTRIVSGIVGILLLYAVAALNSVWFGFLLTIISIVGIYEFYNSMSSAGFRPVKTAGYAACLLLFVISLNSRYKFIKTAQSTEFLALFAFFVLIVLFLLIIFSAGRYNIIDISLTVFGILYIVFLFSFIILTRNMEFGKLYIWLIFLGAFVTDTFAYFTGRFLGKRKILPVVSPKKTLEGSIGGVIGCTAVMTVFGLIVSPYVNELPIIHFAILGLLCGLISQVGDWSASAVKRYVKIKDYGNLMPGHGGVLDRLDSILFTAPVIYFYLRLVLL